jgi:hypothetical protein
MNGRTSGRQCLTLTETSTQTLVSTWAVRGVYALLSVDIMETGSLARSALGDVVDVRLIIQLKLAETSGERFFHTFSSDDNQRHASICEYLDCVGCSYPISRLDSVGSCTHIICSRAGHPI